MKECCGDTSVFQDEDGQLRCSHCNSRIYDFI